MLRFLIIPMALLAVTSSQERPQRSFHHAHSAASESQIKNAVENNYDDTGPGAKTQEQAFRTYNNLEDALLNYLDDPDTKLPEHERAKAVHRLVRPDLFNVEPIRYVPKITNEYSKFGAISEPWDAINKFTYNNREIGNHYFQYRPDADFRAVEGNVNNPGFLSHSKQLPEPFRLQTLQTVKSKPVSLTHYTKIPEIGREFNPNPQYSFSYGVHDKQTGDSKSAHESRDGGLVRGYYSFLDADGKRRTVRYTADDQHGFRASVDTTDS